MAPYSVVPSMSQRGTWCDNGPAESLWISVNAKTFKGNRFPSLVGAKLETSLHIACYNAERCHSALD